MRPLTISLIILGSFLFIATPTTVEAQIDIYAPIDGGCGFNMDVDVGVSVQLAEDILLTGQEIELGFEREDGTQTTTDDDAGSLAWVRGKDLKLHDLLSGFSANIDELLLNDKGGVGLNLRGQGCRLRDGEKADWEMLAARVEIDIEERKMVYRKLRARMFGIPFFFWPKLTREFGGSSPEGWITGYLKYNSTAGGLDYTHPYRFIFSEEWDVFVAPRMIFRRGPALESQAIYTNDDAYLRFDSVHLLYDKIFHGSTKFQPENVRYAMRTQGYVPAGKLSFSYDLTEMSDADILLDVPPRKNKVRHYIDDEIHRHANVMWVEDSWYLEFALQDIRPRNLLGNEQGIYQLVPALTGFVDREIVPDVLGYTVDANHTSFRQRYADDNGERREFDRLVVDADLWWKPVRVGGQSLEVRLSQAQRETDGVSIGVPGVEVAWNGRWEREFGGEFRRPIHACQAALAR